MERFVREGSGAVMHDPTRAWLAYDGRRWSVGDSAAKELAKRVVRCIWKEAGEATDPEVRGILSKWFVKSQAAAHRGDDRTRAYGPVD